MVPETFNVQVQWTGTQFEATILEIDATVVGATREEVLEHAGRAIVAAQIKAAEERKKKGRRGARSPSAYSAATGTR